MKKYKECFCYVAKLNIFFNENSHILTRQVYLNMFIFQLPFDVLREIFSYDNTYHEFFKNYPLKQKLKNEIIKTNYFKEETKNRIFDTLFELLYSGEQFGWSNEFVSYSPDLNISSYEKSIHCFTDSSNIDILFYCNGGNIGFKIVPKNILENENLTANELLIDNIDYFDGFVVDGDESLQLLKPRLCRETLDMFMEKHKTSMRLPSYINMESFDNIESETYKNDCYHIWFAF